MNPNLTLLRVDNDHLFFSTWEALYLDGVKVSEGDEVNLSDLIQACPDLITVRTVTEDEYEEMTGDNDGQFPDKLED